MNEILFMIGDLPVRTGAALIGFGALALLLLLIIAVVIARSGRRGAEMAMAQAIRADELEERLSEMMRAQSEATGRVDAMGQALAGRQAEMARAVSERLDSVTHRVGQSMEQTTRNTMDCLRVLHERLGIIDNAHKNLTDLTSQVTTLRDVLANKQSRGAFGQARMEAIVQDGMPKGSYEFQFTLSTGKRPDCVVFLPDQRPLCIDAKFPLEAMTALHDARSDEEKKIATQRLRNDVMKHVSDIAEKYLIAGETQDTALMFVPSESVYAEIHDGFDDVIQKAYRARVVLVSPSLLMLAIQVMQQILKDARMRDAADQIRTEVLNLGDDLDAPARSRAEAAEAFWRRQRGRPPDPDLRRQDRKARRPDRGAGFQQGAAGLRRGAAPRQAGRARTVPAAAQAAGGGVARGVTWSPQPDATRNLIQPRAAKTLQIVLPIGLVHDGHLACDPGERNIGLRAAKLLQRGRGDIVLSGHAGGRREHPMGADEVAALPDAFARQSNGLVVIAPDELRVGGDAAKHGRKRIARAQPQRAPRGNAAFFPPPGIGQHQTVIALRQREVRIEPKRDLQFRQRILETPR